MNHLDQAKLRQEIESRLGGDVSAEGKSLAVELAADWAREADGDPDAQAINKVQRDDLDAALAGKSTLGRLTALRVHMLERLVRRVAGKTYKLGCALIDGRLPPDAGREQGKQLLQEVEQLSARVGKAGDSDAEARLRRDLGDAMMEALYAIEGKAMSLRLNRYAESQAKH